MKDALSNLLKRVLLPARIRLYLFKRKWCR